MKVYMILIALSLGSFYNVFALRKLEGMDYIFTPSHCRTCKKELGFLEMIPLISYIVQLGRCRSCGSEIGILYLWGELITPLAYFVAFKYSFGRGELILNLWFLTILILASITDIERMIVEDKLILLGVFFSLIIRLLFLNNGLIYLRDAFISFTILHLIYSISRGGLGGADVKIYFLIGLVIGWKKALFSLFYSSWFALAYIIIVFLRGREVRQLKIPFIPFILLGVLLTYIK